MQSSVRSSDALKALAPWLASDIAKVFPFPHLAFFGLSAARMHLLGLSLLGLDAADIDNNRLRARKWSDMAEPVFHPVPVGLEGILAKMALPMWSLEDYRRLWHLMGCPFGFDHLLHAPVLTPEIIWVLSELPAALRHECVTRHLHRPIEARVLAHVLSDDKIARRFLASVRNCKRRETFFRRAAKLVCETRKFDAAPALDHPKIKPIRTAEELRSVALKFRNCLRSYTTRASIGEVAFYLYDDAKPAVIMLSNYGNGLYVLSQIRGLGNTAISDPIDDYLSDAVARDVAADDQMAIAVEFIPGPRFSLALAYVLAIVSGRPAHIKCAMDHASKLAAKYGQDIEQLAREVSRKSDGWDWLRERASEPSPSEAYARTAAGLIDEMYRAAWIAPISRGALIDRLALGLERLGLELEEQA
jgi:hypothetical protein